MDATTLRKKLLDGTDDGPLARLAALCVDALLDTQVAELLPRDESTHAALRLALAWLESPRASESLEALVEETVARLQADRRTVGEAVPSQVESTLRSLIARPFSPDKRLVLTLIDRGPTRELVRQLLTDVVLDFGRRASAPVAGVARGLGTLARMAGETVKARSGGLGSLVGAVSGEVERQLEKRAAEFVEAALGGVFGAFADALSDPARAEDAAQLRLALFDGALELTLPQLAREVLNGDVPGGAQVLREGLSTWLSTDAAQPLLDEVADTVIAHHRGRTLREALDAWGLAEAGRAVAVEQLSTRLRAVVGTGAFAAWLEDVLRDAP